MADGTYAVDGMYARSSFGAQVISTPTRHIVINSLAGSFVSEAQLENELPYGSQITIYDAGWNVIEQLQYRPDIENWYTNRFVHNGSKTDTYLKYMECFVVDDRWLVFPAGYTRNWTGASWTHYGLSFGFLDLDAPEKYDDTNEYGITYEYTNLSFIAATDTPRERFSVENAQITTIGGKQKVIICEWRTAPEQPGIDQDSQYYDGDVPYAPAMWIHDVESMINAGLNNLGTGVVVPNEQSFDVFVGDGTIKGITHGTYLNSGNTYTMLVPEGYGPAEGTVVYSRPALPTLTADTDQFVITDDIKTELYQYVNGSWSLSAVVPNVFTEGQLYGPMYFVDDKLYFDFVNKPDVYLRYQGSSKFHQPFELSEPNNYPFGLNPDPVTISQESGPRKLRFSYNEGNLTPWINQYPRSVSAGIQYYSNGTYELTSNGEVLSSGRWLDRSISPGESYTIDFDLVSNSNEDDPNIVVSLGDRYGRTSLSEEITSGETISFGCSVKETDLAIDPSTPITTTVVFKSRSEGISRLSTSEQLITAELTLAGIPNPGSELTDPNVIIDVSTGPLMEWPDDAVTYFALNVMKPNVPNPTNQQGFVPETLSIASDTESVEFRIISGYAMDGQQMRFEFGDGWVDSYGDSLGPVVINLHQSDIVDPNPSGDSFPQIIFDARLGAITPGQDLSVTVSTEFVNWRQNSFSTSGITTTMTRNIQIKVADALF